MIKKLKLLLLCVLTIFFMMPVSESVSAAADKDGIQRYLYDGHLYAVVDNPNGTMGLTGLEQYAESLGGHLVYIESAGENQFVYNLILQHGNLGYYALGIYRSSDGWRYYNGNKICYSNWDSGQPDNAGGVESYGEIYRSNGHWNDIPNTYRGATSGAIIEWDVDDSYFKIDGGYNTVKEGDFIDLEVKINNREEFSKVMLELAYNNDVLELEKVTAADGLRLVKNKMSEGTITSNITSTDRKAINDGAILNLRFKGVAKGSTTIDFNKITVSKTGTIKQINPYESIPKTIIVE